jgi:hypothetical protein
LSWQLFILPLEYFCSLFSFYHKNCRQFTDLNNQMIYIFIGKFISKDLSKQTPIKSTSKLLCLPVFIKHFMYFLLSHFFISNLLIISKFWKSKVDDNDHTYTNPLSTYYFKLGNQPKPASRILFCQNSTFLICYSVE